MDFYRDISPNIDLRDELHTVLHGSEELAGQGRTVILRRLSNTTCPGCWDPKTGGSTRPNCPYCQGEGYQFIETRELMALFRGVAPVYKPGVLDWAERTPARTWFANGMGANASSMDPGSPTGGRGKPIKFFASPTCSPPMSSMRIGVYQPGFPVSQFYPYAMGQ